MLSIFYLSQKSEMEKNYCAPTHEMINKNSAAHTKISGRGTTYRLPFKELGQPTQSQEQQNKCNRNNEHMCSEPLTFWMRRIFDDMQNEEVFLTHSKQSLVN